MKEPVRRLLLVIGLIGLEMLLGDDRFLARPVTF